jgi:hypothetical protein
MLWGEGWSHDELTLTAEALSQHEDIALCSDGADESLKRYIWVGVKSSLFWSLTLSISDNEFSFSSSKVSLTSSSRLSMKLLLVLRFLGGEVGSASLWGETDGLLRLTDFDWALIERPDRRHSCVSGFTEKPGSSKMVKPLKLGSEDEGEQ